jgi:hypothetical protein
MMLSSLGHYDRAVNNCLADGLEHQTWLTQQLRFDQEVLAASPSR